MTTAPHKRWFSSDVRHLRQLCRALDVRLAHFFIPIVLGLFAAVFEGMSLGLLIPLAEGIIARDATVALRFPALAAIDRIAPFLLPRSSGGVFVFLLSAVFLTGIMKIVLHYFSQIGVAYQVSRFSDAMRRALVIRYLSCGKYFFDRTSQGQVNYVLINCNDIITNEIVSWNEMFSRAFQLIVYIVMMFIISWKLTAAIMAVFPVLHYSLQWLIRRIGSVSRECTGVTVALNRLAANIITCIPLIKAYSTERAEEKRFVAASENVRRQSLRLYTRYFLMRPIQDAILLSAVLLLAGAMIVVSVRGNATLMGGFLVYFLLLRRATDGFRIPNEIKRSLATIDGPLTAVLAVLNGEDAAQVPDGERVFPGLVDLIEYRNVHFAYTPEVPVLKGFSLRAKKGEMTALVGPTGAGKTTVVSLLMRFYDCPSGEIFLDGEDIRSYRLSSLHERISLVSQEVLLFDATLEYNVTYGAGRTISEAEMAEVLSKARLDEFVRKLPRGIHTEVGERGMKLSGGEKQRVAIARAMVRNAPILILDEATSSLDSLTEKLVQEAIEEAVRGRTTLVIAHRLSTIKNAAHIAVVEDGRVAEEGTLRQLLDRRGRFYRYWEEQKFF